MLLQQCPTDTNATVTGPASGGKTLDNKNLSRSFVFLTMNPSGIEEVARILVWGTPARSYASVWLRIPGDWRGGHGFAGGYGYHRGSAAVNRALNAAGIALDDDIEGRGDSSYPSAISAALRAVGENRPVYMVQAY